MSLIRNFFQVMKYLAAAAPDRSMSRELKAIERNRRRLGIGLTDDQFAELIARNERNGKRAERVMFALAIFVIAVCLYDPLAETLSLALQFAVKALENLA